MLSDTFNRFLNYKYIIIYVMCILLIFLYITVPIQLVLVRFSYLGYRNIGTIRIFGFTVRFRVFQFGFDFFAQI